LIFDCPDLFENHIPVKMRNYVCYFKKFTEVRLDVNTQTYNQRIKMMTVKINRMSLVKTRPIKHHEQM
jgi:hypothetical protein